MDELITVVCGYRLVACVCVCLRKCVRLYSINFSIIILERGNLFNLIKPQNGRRYGGKTEAADPMNNDCNVTLVTQVSNYIISKTADKFCLTSRLK